MVIAYHVIFGAYGFWLPNDPRGPWSTEVWAHHLQPFGGATKVDTRQSLADRGHDRSLRLGAREHLQYPAVQFTPLQYVEDNPAKAGLPPQRWAFVRAHSP